MAFEQLFLANSYVVVARILPATLLLLPAMLLGQTLFSIPFNTSSNVLWFWGLATLVFALIASLGVRDLGVQKEKQLTKKWGGWPTTLLLEKPSDVFDEPTRLRFVSLLSKAIAQRDKVLGLNKSEAKNFNVAAAIGYLQECTRGVTFSILHLENSLYGMQRNLLGAKPIGLSVTLFCICVLLTLNLFPTSEPTTIHSLIASLGPSAHKFVLLSTVLFIWIFVVSERAVKVAGFRYAKTLIRTVETPGVFETKK
jgi:hypothetical protein